MDAADNDLLILEGKVDDLVVSQITLQSNVHEKIEALLQDKTQVILAVNMKTTLLNENCSHLYILLNGLNEKLLYVVILEIYSYCIVLNNASI